jgi:hypothetical protein
MRIGIGKGVIGRHGATGRARCAKRFAGAHILHLGTHEPAAAIFEGVLGDLDALRQHKRAQAELKMANRTTYRDQRDRVREGVWRPKPTGPT